MLQGLESSYIGMYNSHPLIKPLPPKATPLVCPDFSVNRDMSYLPSANHV